MNFVGLDIAIKKASTGKEGDAVSTQQVYKRINTFDASFLADLDVADVVLCTDIYLRGRRLILSIACLFEILSSGTLLKLRPPPVISARLLYFFSVSFQMHAMNASGKIPRNGMIREDTLIKDFMQDMLDKKANSEDMQLRDLHADMDRQITCSGQLRLVDYCYDSCVMTNLSAMAKSNVVTGYTLSSQTASRDSDSHGIMITHGFVKSMCFLGEGKDIDHFVHNHGKTNRVGCVAYEVPFSLYGEPGFSRVFARFTARKHVKHGGLISYF